eukprot:5592641-Pyramimonas_sp.AAC.1
MNQLLIDKAIEKVRKDLSPSGVAFTAQMQQRLDDWKSGRMLSGEGPSAAGAAAPSEPPEPTASAASAPPSPA